MKIGIIGAGNIGATLTRRFAELGHRVSVANSRGPETLRELAAQTGASAVSVTQAARDKDLVIVTIPEKNLPDLPGDLFTDAGETIKPGSSHPHCSSPKLGSPRPTLNPNLRDLVMGVVA